MRSAIGFLVMLGIAAAALTCPAMTTKKTPTPQTPHEGCYVLRGDKVKWVDPCPVNPGVTER